MAYSKWISPKRTRSYPFARIYNTYNASKVTTIIPVIKDEGIDGDIDKLQYSTISWMNLLNIYIVLAYYEKAEKSRKRKQISRDKLAKQMFNTEFVKTQINEIMEYRQSALHWNKNLFEERFTNIFRRALDSYTRISHETGVRIHSHERLENYLQSIIEDFEEFKDISLKGSQSASRREAMTSHAMEHLVDGVKATFAIENYLGGIYYLTPDEVVHSKNKYIIPESKNTSRSSLPRLDDIQDGLFKLILYSNLDSLFIDDEEVEFSAKLKLTGKNISGFIILPASIEELRDFLNNNIKNFSNREIEIIKKLNLEASHNQKLEIEIRCNF